MSSYYENSNNPSWSAPARQPSWEQQAPPSRSSTASASRDESAAFTSQFEEIDRASDNLVKSGKFVGQGPPGPHRRESTPQAMGRPYGPDYANPQSTGPARHHHSSVSEYDGMRSPSAANLQGYYANQRFQQPRANEAEQMMQAKRRMAAQRERELRNYHQEQQYNRNTTSTSSTTPATSAPKPDRSLSPDTWWVTASEDERRELIARQHRALYGNDSKLYSPAESAATDGAASVSSAAAAQRRQSQDVRVGSAGPRGDSPFGAQAAAGGEPAVQMPLRDLAKSPNAASSPSSASPSYGVMDNAQQQSSRTSASSLGESPPPAQRGPGGNNTVPPPGALNNSHALQDYQMQLMLLEQQRKKRQLMALQEYEERALSDKRDRMQAKTASAASSAAAPGDKPISGLGASLSSSNGGWGGAASKKTSGAQASVWG